jgi:hypothetical protein
VNSDGALDAVISNSLTDNISVLLGDWLGSVGAAADFRVGDSPSLAVLAVLNADGALDAVSANPDSADISVLLGTRFLGTSFCSSTVNSTGAASIISAIGSASIADDDLQLYASNAPGGASALFYFGASEVSIPFGNGIRCVAGSTRRMPLVSEAAACFAYDVDMVAFGGRIGALGTTKFQCWHRDPAGGGAMFNLSDAVSIDMVP